MDVHAQDMVIRCLGSHAIFHSEVFTEHIAMESNIEDGSQNLLSVKNSSPAREQSLETFTASIFNDSFEVFIHRKMDKMDD
jgi:hypothetical protein